MKYIFAGDRDISVWVLKELITKGFPPLALLVTDSSKATHARELMAVSGLSEDLVMEGKFFQSSQGMALLNAIEPDYIIGVHFPYIIQENVLKIPKVGFINLHPSYLPFNRGWHTPSWAILDRTPIGATLHFMSTELDNGDVIHQKKLDVRPCDTANSLYVKLKELELEVFMEALPLLISKRFSRKSLDLSEGTIHKKSELFQPEVQEIVLSEYYQASVLIDKIRALTTNQWSESAYFESNGKKYRLRIEIIEDER
jgi:methionyl-tRNA formyltransferase